MPRTSFKRLFTMMLLVLSVPVLLMAQGFQVGTIAGTISDETGAVLPGVTVTATSQERGTARTEMTDSGGRFRFASMPLGRYTLSAELSGFQTLTAQNILVEQDKTTTVNPTMRLAAETATITITGDAPIVDKSNTQVTTRVSTQEYEKAPVGRSYQSLAAFAPGAVDTRAGGNPNSSGALAQNNQYLFDGVDATDPTNGQFGANLNFEAIQEVNVLTNGVSAEYGRATGAIVSVVTKSGTNEFEGSLKAIATNDKWNEQNKTINTLTGASLARTKNDHENIRYSGTLGGPIWRDRAWFFGAYEEFKQQGTRNLTAISGEEWTSNPLLKLHNYRVNAQLTPSHLLWAKYATDPFTGITRGDYNGSNGDLYTLILQGQTGSQKAVQYSGVFGSRFTTEAFWGSATNVISVDNYLEGGPFDNGSAVYDWNRRRYLNGFYFSSGDNVSRPREQYTVAGTYFANLGNDTHEIKAGLDRQDFESSSYLTYTNNRLYEVYFDPATYTFDPTRTGQFRYDFHDQGPQTSTGTIDTFYLRDKFTVGDRLFFEVGARFENQDGNNDRGVKVIDAQSVAPRLAASFDILGDGRNVITATGGRFYDFIVQSFADGFAQTVQRGVYDVYEWDPTVRQWVFLDDVDEGGASISPNLDLEPAYVDEITLGFNRQLGTTMAFGVRGILREWGNLIDDHRYLDDSGSARLSYINTDLAKRKYRAIQTTFEKRFSQNWSMLANYTYSKAEGNHFATTASSVNNYRDQNCVGTADDTLTVQPCTAVEAMLYGRASYDIPHLLNVLGTYAHSLGPVNLAYGLVGNWRSGEPLSKAGTVRVLTDSGANTSNTITYYYGGFNSERLPSVWTADTSLEATFNVFNTVEMGVKGEVFNVTNNQEVDTVATNAWCNGSSAACATQRAQWGSRTIRAHYQDPRAYRLTALIRF